jgi:hypothetical protein
MEVKIVDPMKMREFFKNVKKDTLVYRDGDSEYEWIVLFKEGIVIERVGDSFYKYKLSEIAEEFEFEE